MSLLRRERRTCDICKELISNDVKYYICKPATNTSVDEFREVGTGLAALTQVHLGISYSNNPPPELDICVDCWKKIWVNRDGR